MACEYHAHTERCGHATGAMEAYVERALALGFEEFGFSEHSPWMYQQTGQWQALRWDEVAAYVADVKALQKKYDRVPSGGDGKGTGTAEKGFRIRLGMEMDFVPTRLAQAREAIAKYEWDYLLGSVHHLGMWCLPSKSQSVYFDTYQIEDVVSLYFEHIAMMVRERFCDIISHIDFLKRFGHQPKGGMLRWVEPLISEIKAAGMAFEINASGLDHAVAEPYPNWPIIAALAAAKIPMIISSDAHAPEQVGRHRAEIVAGLKKLGVTELVRFEKRKMIPCALD